MALLSGEVGDTLVLGRGFLPGRGFFKKLDSLSFPRRFTFI
jgi:hypothetical protein